MMYATERRKLIERLIIDDGSFFEETYNLLNAWLSIVPGNGAHNLRRLALLETNLADLSFLFTLDHGDAASPHLGQEVLAVFETPHRTPYAFNTCFDACSERGPAPAKSGSVTFAAADRRRTGFANGERWSRTNAWW